MRAAPPAPHRRRSDLPPRGASRRQAASRQRRSPKGSDGSPREKRAERAGAAERPDYRVDALAKGLRVLGLFDEQHPVVDGSPTWPARPGSRCRPCTGW